MKKKAIISILTVVLVAVTLNFAKMHHEETMIKETLLEGYVHGAFNGLNPEAMQTTFHEDFAIFSPGKDGAISKYPIKTWVESTKKRKSSADFNAAENKWDHKFKAVKVSGNAAMVELELHKDGNHVFTDYLSLLKFDDTWRVVAKVYYRHQ